MKATLATLVLLLALPVAAAALPIIGSEDISLDPGPPAHLQITIQDEDGLTEIVVTESFNADTVVPPFTPGTTDPVIVTSTLINQLGVGELEFRFTDLTAAQAFFAIEFSTRGFDVVPEPTTLALLGLGFGALALMRRRAPRI